MSISTYSTKWGDDTVTISADWAQASWHVEGLNSGQQVADFRHDWERALRCALEECASIEGLDIEDAATQKLIEDALSEAVWEESELCDEIRAFATEEAQDVSHGIWESAISLADCLNYGSVSLSEANEQFAELREKLEEAKEAQ
jgi:hypothetical protein